MEPRYKIIHTTCHTLWGGLEKRIYNESVWMARNGHTVLIAAPADTPLYNKARASGFDVTALGFRGPGLVGDYFRLKALFSRERPDIVNTHGNADSKVALLAAAAAKVPLRILSRHISVHVRPSVFNRLLYQRLARMIFTTASYTTRHLQERFSLSSDQVLTMPSGTRPPKTLMPRQTARKRVCSELGINDETARLAGFVGRLSEDKGISLVIKAFEKVRRRFSAHHLVIVGLGLDDYVASLRALAGRLGIEDRVHFTGFKENVWHYYRAFDLSLLASQDVDGIPFEGVPQSILESMFSGCPVVGAKSGGVPDVIEHEKTGLLFDGSDPADLAEKIIRTISDPEAAALRVDNARQMVNRTYTIDAMGEKALAAYTRFFNTIQY